METVDLIQVSDGTIKKVKIADALHEMYLLKCRVPTEEELKKYGSDQMVDEIKRKISSNEQWVPLYDVYTYNIYLIQMRNVYKRVVNHNYRFPDELIMDIVKKTRDKNIKKMKKHPELEKNKVFTRQIRKANLMIDFIDQLDMRTLYDSYVRTFYKYSPMMGNSAYTCVKKSFIPHVSHLEPYYTHDDVIKMGMNMGIVEIPENVEYIDYKDGMTKEDYVSLCNQIQKNDISSDVLIEHQKFIIDNKMEGLVQYYTIQGSYFINQYMRSMGNYEYKNDFLEENITKIWKLVINAPGFDKNYILYRFVTNDSYLQDLNIGDIYVEKGFTSTTRDPFYMNDLYKFGFVLIKIRIPKKTIGVGLSIELTSLFPEEEEIILPPLAHLRLISKNESCEYYHPNDTFVANIKTRYEFEWVKNADIKYPKKSEYKGETKLIDFLKLKKIKTLSIKEKINHLVRTEFDPMSRIQCKIGDNTYYVIAEAYNSTSTYEGMYALKTSEGFSMYSFYDGYMIFMIEIGEMDGYNHIKVNYYTKHIQLDRQKIMGDDNFIKFIASIAHYFDITEVVIRADYMSCEKLYNDQKLLTDSVKDVKDSKISRGTLFPIIKTNPMTKTDPNPNLNPIKKTNPMKKIKGEDQDEKDEDKKDEDIPMQIQIPNLPRHYTPESKRMHKKKQRAYEPFDKQTIKHTRYNKNEIEHQNKRLNLKDDEEDESDKEKESEKNEEGKKENETKCDTIRYVTNVDEENSDRYVGGSYCVDFYNYFKHLTKRYEGTNTLNVELQPVFSYHDLDNLRTISPLKILKKEDRDEIFQIYTKTYLFEVSGKKDNVADFYVWMVENKCYLMDIFVDKIDKLYKDNKNNPFRQGMYKLDAMTYLYNRRYIETYNRHIKLEFNHEFSNLSLPKNEYRIKR